MSQEIIVDTSALIAFFVRSENHQQAAQQYCRKNPQKPWIILEAKEVGLADSKLFVPVLNEVEEMQGIMVTTLKKLKQ